MRCSLVGICILVITITAQMDTKIYYVTSNGDDNDGCGGAKAPCGTLYYVSKQILQSDTDVFYYIIGVVGQNRGIIRQHISNSSTAPYSPCVPLPFFKQHIYINIRIVFFVESMNDWYPKRICNEQQYENKYIFEIYGQLEIDSLIINDYDTDMIPMGIANVKDTKSTKSSGFTFVNCSFVNITHTLNYAMFDMEANSYGLVIKTSVFMHIYSKSDFISVRPYALNMMWITTEISDCVIAYCSFAQSMISLHSTTNTNDYVPLKMERTHFSDIQTNQSIIHTHSAGTNLQIVLSTFMNIISGSIIMTDRAYSTQKDVISMSYIYISTAQIYSDTALFNFNETTEAVMDHVAVEYYYDFITNCKYTKNEEEIKCVAPVSLIKNTGNVTMTDIVLKNTITMDEFEEYTQNITDLSHVYMRYNQTTNGDADCGIYSWLICNLGDMQIENIDIDGAPFGSVFIFHGLSKGNAGSLYVNYLNVNGSKFIQNSRFNPNVLQSDYIIVRYSDAPTFIYNSSFIGGNLQMYLSGHGDTKIINCSFQYAARSIHIQLDFNENKIMKSNITIENCEFRRIGRYYGRYDNVKNGYDAPAIYSRYAQYFTILSCNFSTFDPKGIMVLVDWADQYMIKDNTFTVDYDDLFYNVTAAEIYIKEALITMSDTKVSSFIGNTFVSNDVDSSKPWIYYKGSLYGWKPPQCLYANNFTNFAFYSQSGTVNITSCNRPQLIECIMDSKYCKDTMYGAMNYEEYYYQPSTFTVTTKIKNIFDVESNSIAMDNVKIEIMDHVTDQVPFTITNGNVFLLDAMLIHSQSLAYSNESCDVVYNDRLASNTNYIAKLLVKCNASYSDENTVHIMNATALVNHLSASQIQLKPFNSSSNTTYFPGGYLLFEYFIMDSLGNVINITNDSQLHFNDSDDVMITISNDDLSLLAEIEIYGTGECPICDLGVVIFGANLFNKIWKKYKIDLVLSSPHYLLLSNKHIYVDIVGCPIGYGATKNEYQCAQCPDAEFNFLSNSTTGCTPCNEHIICKSGQICVEHNQWVHVHRDFQSISSGICPSSYCCRRRECLYSESLENETLCASHRDPDSRLCSECIAGYSHVFRSTNCQKCDEMKLYPLPLLIFFLYGSFIAIYLLYSQTDIVNVKQKNIEQNKDGKLKSCWKSYSMKMMKLMLFNGAIYYEQSLSQIITFSNLKLSAISWWISLFNISILEESETEHDGYCFYDGMNAKDSILSGLLVLFIIVFTLLMFGCVCLRQKATICGYECTPKYSNIFICFMLLSVGKLSSIFFSLLSCQTINNTDNDDYAHFYFAFEDCYGSTWFWSLFGLISLMILFMILFVILYKMGDTKRQNQKENKLYDLISSYKPDCYYWELIIFCRRMLLALLVIAFQSTVAKFLLLIILLTNLFVHHKYKPFIIKQMNDLECLLISCLCGVIFIDAAFGGALEDNATFYVLSITIFATFPFVLILYFVINHLRKEKKETSKSHSTYIQLQNSDDYTLLSGR